MSAPLTNVVIAGVRVYHQDMEGILFFVGFLILWFVVLPRIPGVSRFT
jgi:hypothetical protein